MKKWTYRVLMYFFLIRFIVYFTGMEYELYAYFKCFIIIILASFALEIEKKYLQ